MKEINDVKNTLKERRVELGYTMKELANLVGVSEATISRWESGDIANMRRDRIAKLAQALKISPAVIMGWDNSSSSGSEEAAPTYYLDPEAAELAQALYERPEMRVLFDASRNATKEDIEQVADILDKLSKK